MGDSIAEIVAKLKSQLINLDYDLAHGFKGSVIVKQKREGIALRLTEAEKLLLLEKKEEERQRKLAKEKMIKDFMDKPFVNLSKDKTYFTISVSGMEFLFDSEEEEVKKLSELSNVGGLEIDKDGYLCEDGFHIHTNLRLIWIQRKELSEKLDCDIKDIHAHHIYENKQDNRKKNLEVLHKDEHAKKHGFPTWDALKLSR